MIALIIIGIIALIITIILLLRCFVTVEYSDDIYLKFRLLFWVVDLFEEDNVTVRTKSLTKKQAERFEKRLAKERAKGKAKQKPKVRPHSTKKKVRRLKKLKKGVISEILKTLGISLKITKSAIKHLFGYLRVDVAKINVRVATDDAATTAMAYGSVCHAVSALVSAFEDSERVRGFDPSDINISCDYLTDETVADIKILFSVRVWQVASILIGLIKDLTNEKIENMERSELQENTKKKKKKK